MVVGVLGRSISKNIVKASGSSYKLRLSDYGFTILQIETYLFCNMKCSYCAYPIIENKGAKLPTENVYKAIDEIDSTDSNLEYVCFNQYNEPLIDERIYSFIEYAKDKGLKVLIITNGLLFKTKEIRDKLIDIEPTYIKISLETLDEKTYASSRGTKSLFGEYKQGIFEFLDEARKRKTSAKIVVDIACNFLTGINMNIRKLLGLEIGDPAIPNTIAIIKPHLINFLRELNQYSSDFIFDPVRINEYFKKINKNYFKQEELHINENISIKVKPFIYGRRLSEFYPVFKANKCETRILSVTADGAVVPCCLAYGNMLNMGNIHEKTLKQIVNENIDFIEGIKKGYRMPEVCKRCKGAPTKRGALAISLFRFLKATDL